MLRNRQVLGLVLVFALAVVLGCSASSAGSEDLEQQVKALTQRVEALEKELAAVKAAGPASAAQEQQAAAALAQINQLVAAGNAEEAKKQLAEFQKTYANTRSGQTAGRLAQELAVVGKEVPQDWGIEKWFQGQDKIDLSGKGTTLVVFWETWCPHCQREVPKLEALYDSYNPKGLQVVGLTKVSRSATDEGVSQFITEQKLTYPVAKENGAASTHFGVSGIPAAAVVKDGHIVWRGHPANLSEDMLKGWL
jgi:thiol-disulfide isomerase/thioredoxin